MFLLQQHIYVMVSLLFFRIFMCIHPIKLIARVLRDWGRDSEVNVLAREAKGSALLKQPQTWNVVCEFFSRVHLESERKWSIFNHFTCIALLAVLRSNLGLFECFIEKLHGSSKLSFIKIRFTYIAERKLNLGQKKKVASAIRRQEEISIWSSSKLFHVFNWSSVKKNKRVVLC